MQCQTECLETFLRHTGADAFGASLYLES